jgi:hypothetical protein
MAQTQDFYLLIGFMQIDFARPELFGSGVVVYYET